MGDMSLDVKLVKTASKLIAESPEAGEAYGPGIEVIMSVCSARSQYVSQGSGCRRRTGVLDHQNDVVLNELCRGGQSLGRCDCSTHEHKCNH